MKFPKPWQIEQCDPTAFIVMDATGRKLFYIHGDEGDGEDYPPSALCYSDDDEDTKFLLNEITEMFGRLS